MAIRGSQGYSILTGHCSYGHAARVIDPQGSEAQLLSQLLQSWPQLLWRALPWLLAYCNVRQGASLIATLHKLLHRAEDRTARMPPDCSPRV